MKYGFFSNEIPEDIVFNEVGPGWKQLLVDFFAKFDEIYGENNYSVQQIKEKFGELRIYYTANLDGREISKEKNDEIWSFLSEIEGKSVKTCEFCGEPGENKSGKRKWMKTLCDACFKRWDTV